MVCRGGGRKCCVSGHMSKYLFPRSDLPSHVLDSCRVCTKVPVDSDRPDAAVGDDNLLVSRCEQSGGGAVASQVHIDSDTLYHCEGRRVPSLTNANHTPAAFYIIAGSPPAHRQPLLWAWPTRDTA